MEQNQRMNFKRFVMEMIQSAYRRVVARQSVERDFAGEICVSFDLGNRFVSFADDGCGISREDMERMENSTFIVESRIIVQSHKPDESESFRWECWGAGATKYSPLSGTKQGTVVTAFLKAEYADFLDMEKLQAILSVCCDNVSASVYVKNSRKGERERVNVTRSSSRISVSELDGREAVNLLDKLVHQNDELRTILRSQTEDIFKIRREIVSVKKDFRNLTEEIRKQAEKDAVRRSDHIVLFMITPYKSEYNLLQQAVKHMFAREPFCFETQIATDLYTEDRLWDNISNHIKHAHGFVVELSEQNPNVMMEVGAVIHHTEDRFLFPLEMEPRKREEAADIKGLQTYHYAAVDTTNVSEKAQTRLENQLRSHLYKDGKIKNKKLASLIVHQRKALFLSDILFKDYSHLREDEVKKILEEIQPSTVESFLSADAAKLHEITDIRKNLIEEAQEMMEKNVKRRCDRIRPHGE